MSCLSVIAVFVLFLWLLGFSFHLGSLIHLLLFVALVVFVADILRSGSR
jgi:hypothetical protein